MVSQVGKFLYPYCFSIITPKATEYILAFADSVLALASAERYISKTSETDSVCSARSLISSRESIFVPPAAFAFDLNPWISAMMSSFGIAVESVYQPRNRQFMYLRNRCQIYRQSLGVWESPNDWELHHPFQVRDPIPNRLDDALNRISHFRTGVNEIFQPWRTMIDRIYKLEETRFTNGPEAKSSFSIAASPVPEDGAFSFCDPGQSSACRPIAVAVDSNCVPSMNIVVSSSRGSSN